MTYTVSLRSARSKWKAAEVHRETLQHSLASVRDEAHAIALRPEADSDTGYHLLRVEKVPDFDELFEQVGLAVGDVVQNLRGSLDHLFWQLACLKDNGQPENERAVHFPLCDTERSFKKNKARGTIDAAHWSRIKEFQPYKGPNGRGDVCIGPYVHQLTQLRELSNTDKHRTLNTVLIVPQGFGSSAPPSASVNVKNRFVTGHAIPIPDFTPLNVGEPLEPGLPVFRAAFDAQPRMEQHFYMNAEVGVGEGWPAPVGFVLARLASFVDLMLREFEALFP